MPGFDDFYPISTTMKNAPQGLWQIGLLVIIDKHLEHAKNGCRESESRLINRIGQLKRNVPFNAISDELKKKIKKSVEWLETTGRKVDLKNEDPRFWISNRKGGPRW